MSKLIIVLRHAQSAGKQSGQRDYDRTLTPQGEADARAAGKKLKQNNFNPDLILSSSATRTRQTVGCLNESLHLPSQNIRFKSELYEASRVDWLAYIYPLSDEVKQVLLVGHNPWLSMLASSFGKSTFDLAPCEFMAFSFEVDLWKEIGDLGSIIYRL